MPTFSFNVTSENLEKRKVFGDLRFRQAMSVAINRHEINVPVVRQSHIVSRPVM